MLLSDRNGTIIMLAVIMTAVLLVAGIVIATLAVREARISSIADNGTIAYYGAETALEQSAYQVLKQGADPLTLDGNQQSYAQEGEWIIEAYEETDEFVFDFISAETSVTLALYNRDEEGDAAGVSNLALDWTSGTQLAVERESWDGGALQSAGSTTLNCSSGPCSGNVSLNPNLAYNITLTAPGTAVTDLIVSTGATVDTSTTVVANSTYQGAEQSLQMTLPVAAPWEGGGSEAGQTCGDGTTEGDEECDDGNTQDGDGCSSTCTVE